MNTPQIIVNFKTYESIEGFNAVKLARVCASVARSSKVRIALAVSALDLSAVAKAVDIPVFAQHVDACPAGAHTGWIVPSAVKHAGAVGTLLNHAEHQLPFSAIAERVKMCKKLGLFTCVCAASVAQVRNLAVLKPDVLAYEPPALIGGDISVSTANPNVVKKAVEAAGRVKLYCGAGVKTGEDVRKARELGTIGVLLASGVVLSAHPRAVLKDLVKGL